VLRSSDLAFVDGSTKQPGATRPCAVKPDISFSVITRCGGGLQCDGHTAAIELLPCAINFRPLSISRQTFFVNICILGAGVIGLTTAWRLSEAGHQVTVIDRNAAPAAETSFGNGAQLSYAFVSPLASPSTLRKILPMLFTNDPAIRLRPPPTLEFLRWGYRFVEASTGSRSKRTTRELLSLAALSRQETALLAEEIGVDFGFRTAGKLVVYRGERDFASARKAKAIFGEFGIEQHSMTAQECLRLEPILHLDANDFSGGILTPSEQVGDCARFCEGLATKIKQRRDVLLLLSTNIQQPIIRDNRVVAVRTSKGEIEADVFVLCMGSDSAAFTRHCGLSISIYPMKGYSLTARIKPQADTLTHSITDFSKKIVYAPLDIRGDRSIRIAGMADFVGYDRRINLTRIASLKQSASEFLDIDFAGEAQQWAGLRPATPDGRPLIGWSGIENLFLNTGHGGLGWTLAGGSARIARDMICSNNRTLAASYDGWVERVISC
jgi:D-amino-acid dehydrogenase